MKISSNRDTWLKKNPIEAANLPDDKKSFWPVGKTYTVEIEENENEESGQSTGHISFEISHGAGEWFAYAPHIIYESHKVIESPKILPEWDEVDWNDWGAPASKYFTVGEVTNMSRERIPTATDIKKNIIAIARNMDDIREWWGGPLGVNSWYRPWHVNTRIGSNAPNHPNGYAVDFRPLGGSVWELQKRFQAEWYNAGKWNGGFGLGARRGFIHLDLRGKRVWNY